MCLLAAVKYPLGLALTARDGVALAASGGCGALIVLLAGLAIL